MAAALLGVAGGLRDAADRWIDATVLPPLTAETSVEVLDRDGHLLRAYTVADGRWRLKTALDQVDPAYIDMLIAYEDQRFYRHTGVDPRAMVRAGWQAVWNGRVISGGSTLTMQTARLLEESGTGQWDGKLRQMRVALALERRLRKDQILTLYLNHAPMGGNIEGVRAATRAWFGKPAHRLTPAEAALLVALPQSPETRRPDRFAGSAKAARDRVLARVAGSGVIRDEAAQSAMLSPVPTARRPVPQLAPHVADRLRRQDPVAQVHRTTLRAPLQRRLQRLMRDAAERAGPNLSAAMIVADHGTGEILASIGSPDIGSTRRQGAVDMTRAVRSPGSTLKPLIYALAFDEGLAHPETLIEDRPTAFGGYAPQNFDGQFRGTIRVRQALQLSLNIPAVMLTERLGPSALTAALTRAGIDPVFPGGKPGLAVALGGVGLTLTDLTQLYAGTANRGRAPVLHVKAAAGDGTRRVISPEAAWQVTNILAGLPPPAHAAHRVIAHKTGTSYGHRDAWAIGYDGQHVIGVWLGRPDGSPVPGAFGGDLAAPVLFEAFGHLKARHDPLPSPPPSVLMVHNTELPQPLRRFAHRQDQAALSDGPKLAFPPDGAELERLDSLTLKVRDGTPPFTWLANGAPLVTRAHRREVSIDAPLEGYLSLSVVDAQGRAARARIRLR
ncbi:penicillin-binding protein 1C [Actibacterium sp. 188UL27-1]|uniref:penicillin-binding protein 1C n=1 Tax=Actibacterium sp. 188UL27-1 TaxID=2786961 RepID=UPI001EF3E59A|nr:penicillin-binding protein 1C [Actibacterium sp. 188UL27-1]